MLIQLAIILFTLYYCNMIKKSRESLFIIILSLLIIVVGSAFSSGADKQLFSDVNQNDWFFPQITRLVELGAIAVITCLPLPKAAII